MTILEECIKGFNEEYFVNNGKEKLKNYFGKYIDREKLSLDTNLFSEGALPLTECSVYRNRGIRDKIEEIIKSKQSGYIRVYINIYIIIDGLVVGIIKENYTGQKSEPNFNNSNLDLVNRVINSFKGGYGKIYHNLLCEKEVNNYLKELNYILENNKNIKTKEELLNFYNLNY